MKRVFIFLTLLAGLAGVAVFGANAYRDQLLAQRVNVQSETQYSIERGVTLQRVLNDFASKGWIEDPKWTYRALRFEGRGELRTGTYSVSYDSTLLALIDDMARGRVVTESLTIIEGSNRWQIREQLAREKWISAETFDALCDDQEFLTSLKVTGPNCEGFIFPETYQFARGVSPRSLMASLIGAWRQALDEITAQGRGPLNLNDLQFTTLASIVEKETGAPKERPRIACVFYNRMKASPPWRLETDPTVIYAATLDDPNFDGNIKRSHLRTFDHPYNTYKRRGLPPGPIASPGRAALEAVRSPSSCEDFFFVSMNNGEHIFCPTYACHQAAVNKWQIEYFRKKRNKQ